MMYMQVVPLLEAIPINQGFIAIFLPSYVTVVPYRTEYYAPRYDCYMYFTRSGSLTIPSRALHSKGGYSDKTLLNGHHRKYMRKWFKISISL